MGECFFCGKQGADFDAVTSEGIMKICRKCSFEEDVPIIRRPTTYQLKEAERKRPSFSEKAERERQEMKKEFTRRENVGRQDITLKDIVNRNFKSKVSLKEKQKVDLIENFHWIILRARRKKHLTQWQLAFEIQESEAAIKMIEAGQLPEDDYKLVNKVENFLGIRIRENDKGYKPMMEREPARVLEFDRGAMNNLTISDLQKMKKAREVNEQDELMDKVRIKLLQDGEIEPD